MQLVEEKGGGGRGGPYKLHAPSTEASCVAKSSFFKSFLSLALNRAYPAGVSARINMDMVLQVLQVIMLLSYGTGLQQQCELMAVGLFVVVGWGPDAQESSRVVVVVLSLSLRSFFCRQTDKGIVILLPGSGSRGGNLGLFEALAATGLEVGHFCKKPLGERERKREREDIEVLQTSKQCRLGSSR